MLAYLKRGDEAVVAIQKSLDNGLPEGLLEPLRWLETDRPAMFECLKHFLN